MHINIKNRRSFTCTKQVFGSNRSIINKAKFLVSINKLEQAEIAFGQGYEKGTNKPVNVLPYCEFLIKNKQESKAEELLVRLITETNNPAAHNMLVQLKLIANFDSGKNYYLTGVKNKLADKDKVYWLAQVCSLISSYDSETDLIHRVFQHWRELE